LYGTRFVTRFVTRLLSLKWWGQIYIYMYTIFNRGGQIYIGDR
jgi:hypothetical protein